MGWSIGSRGRCKCVGVGFCGERVLAALYGGNTLVCFCLILIVFGWFVSFCFFLVSFCLILFDFFWRGWVGGFMRMLENTNCISSHTQNISKHCASCFYIVKRSLGRVEYFLRSITRPLLYIQSSDRSHRCQTCRSCGPIGSGSRASLL